MAPFKNTFVVLFQKRTASDPEAISQACGEALAISVFVFEFFYGVFIVEYTYRLMNSQFPYPFALN
jgi:hypothetical protein